MHDDPARSDRRGFPKTNWPLVLTAGHAPGDDRTEALEALCGAYWPALFSFLRRKGFQPADAEDLTQEFLACLLRRDSLGSVCPAKGHFRSYLLGALKPG